MPKAKISFYGGVGTVTGANFLLEINGVKILVDCGLFQGFKFCEENNGEKFPYEPSSIDYLFITHSHMDHIGRVPKLVKDGFRGEIYSTTETKLISEVMFADAYEIMKNEAASSGVATIYEMEDVHKAVSLWKGVPYHDKIKLKGGVEAFAKDSGHILGSAMFEFIYGGKKIAFTGDLGNSPSPLLKDTESVDEPEYIVMESVYGDRNHESKEDRKFNFKRVIRETIEKKGTLVIPAFSLERTQDILYEINKMVERGEVASVPVFLDSPLAAKVTAIYENFTADFNDEVRKEIQKGDDIFVFPKLKVTTRSQESRLISNTLGPKIIIAGSGMSNGGRVATHEVEYLPDPKNTILLVGYQAVGTIGRQILDGNKKVNIFGTWVKVGAKVETIEGYSAHKDSDHLLEFVEQNSKKLKKVFVTMGETKASLFLVQKLRDSGIDAICPELNSVQEVEF